MSELHGGQDVFDQGALRLTPRVAAGRAAARAYRDEARLILDLADLSKHLQTKQTLLETARLYEKLAEHAELMDLRSG